MGVRNRSLAASSLLAHLRIDARHGAEASETPAADMLSPFGGRSRLLFLFMLASAIIAAMMVQVALGHFPPALIALWAVPSACVFGTGMIMLRPGAKRLPSVRRVQVLAVMTGLVWATMAAQFYDLSLPELRILGAAVLFAMAGVGALAFSRLPAAAIMHSSIIAVTAALTALKLGGDVGAAGLVFSLFYGLTLAGVIMANHRRTLRSLRAARELRRRNDIISLLLNDFEQGASDWLWETGPDLRLTHASPRLATLLGRPGEITTGLPLAELAGSDATAANGWPDFLEKLAARQTVAAQELELNSANGILPCRVSARPLFAAGGAFLGYRGVGRDITVERRAVHELVRAKVAAEQANAAKSQFLAVMSHELKTPLNAIVGFAELLLSPQADYLAAAARTDHLRTILESSRHLQSLINDILDVTRIEKGSMAVAEQEADAAELVEVAVKMCRDLAERADTTIVANILEGVEIKGDITRLKQILINLITNAVKFSTPGGYVHVGFERHHGGVAFTVRDTGLGMKPENIARMFEPFVQADDGSARRFGGMGLGLSIARKLATLHGGDVTLESNIGAGTTARLILPPERVVWTAPPDQAPIAVA